MAQESSEPEVVSRLRKGDHEAFVVLYRSYKLPLAYRLLQLVKNEAFVDAISTTVYEASTSISEASRLVCKVLTAVYKAFTILYVTVMPEAVTDTVIYVAFFSVCMVLMAVSQISMPVFGLSLSVLNRQTPAFETNRSAYMTSAVLSIPSRLVDCLFRGVSHAIPPV